MATRTLLPTNVQPGVYSSVPAPVVVGSPPQWTDSSDGTYSEQYGIAYTANPSFKGNILADIAPVPDITQSLIATVVLRMRVAVSGPVPVTPQVILQAAPGTNYQMTYDGRDPASAVPTWFTAPMALFSGVDMNAVLTRLRDDGLFVESVGVFAPDPGYDYECAWTIYELLLDVTYPETVAPPCRLYPRADSLGVGSGRHYPPPNTHQFSPRRAGATTW